MLVVDLRNPRITTYNYSIVGNKDSDVIYFYSHFVQYANANIYIKALSEYLADKYDVPTSNVSVENDLLIVKWTMPKEACYADKLSLQLQFEVDGKVQQTRIAIIKLGNTLDIEGAIEPIYPHILEHLQEEIDELQDESVADVETDFTDDTLTITTKNAKGTVLDTLTVNIPLSDKVDKTSQASRVYATDTNGNQTTYGYGVNGGNGTLIMRGANGQIIVPQTPTENTHATSKVYVDAFGKTLEVSIDSSYVMTFILKDANGNVLTTQTVDLPLETMVVSGSYDSVNKALILTLDNGQTISIPVADLVDGLVSETQLAQTLLSYYTKTETDNLLSTVARTDRTNNFEYTQAIRGTDDTCLSLQSRSSERCNIMFGSSNTVQLGNIGFNSSYKPEAYTPTDSTWHLIMLDSDITPIQDLLAELKTIVYDNQYPAVAEIDLQYATYYALPSQISGDKIIMSAGMDMTKVKGRSYVVNQLAKELNTDNYYAVNGSLSLTNNVLTYTVNTAVGFFDNSIRQNVIDTQNHTLLLFGIIEVSSNLKCGISTNGATIYKDCSANTKETIIGIANSFTNYPLQIGIESIPAIGDTLKVYAIYVIDLTQWFGSNDAIPADLLADPSLFTKKYWKKSLPFDTGHIENSKPIKVIATGANKCEEAISSEIATVYSPALNIKADLKPNTTYCISFVANVGNICYLNENLVQAWGYFVGTGEKQHITFTTKENISKDNDLQYDPYSKTWLIFKNLDDNTVSAHFENVMLNLGTNEMPYIPFEKHEYPIIPIDMGTVDLGTFNWNYDSAGYFYTSTALVTSTTKWLCAIYSKADVSVSDPLCPNMTLEMGTNMIFIKNTSYTDPTAFKNAMSGVMLNYELATQSHNPLRSVGSAKDTDKKVNIGVVDLGTLDYEIDDGYFMTVINDMKSGMGVYNVDHNVLSSIYSYDYNLATDKTMGLSTSPNSRIWFRNDAYGTDTQAFKTAMSGVMLNYELATPTDQSPAIDLPENIEIQKGGTIEIEYDDGYSTPCDIDFEVAVSKVLEE